MKKEHKYIIAAVVGIAIIVLLWWFVGGLAALIGSLFGGGVARQMAQADVAQARRDTKIEAETEEKIRDIELEEKLETSALKIDEQKRREQLEAQAVQADQEASSRIARAQTKADLNDIEDDTYRRADALLLGEPGEDGWVRASFCFVLIIITLLAIAIAGSPAKATPATEADKARTARRVKIVQRLMTEVKRLRSRVEFIRREHQIQLRTLHRKHKVELQKERRLHASSKMTCAEKIKILSKPPSVWPVVLTGVLATLVAGGIGVGVGIGIEKAKATP